MRTAITEMFGIDHPIVQGGMHYVGFAELAAAVSNAGGLGIITGLTQRTPELLAKEIARCRDMTDKPFGVNLTFLPSFTAPPYPEYIAAIKEGGVKAVETAGRSPEQYMPALKAAGIAWAGFYPARRGISSLVAAVSNPLTSSGVLRNSLAVNLKHYQEPSEESKSAAMRMIEEMATKPEETIQ